MESNRIISNPARSERGGHKPKQKNTMKKTFKFTAYEVFDITSGCRLMDDYHEVIIKGPDRLIKEDDDSLREAWKRRGSSIPFKHHRYVISDVVYTAELNVGDDNYEPSFDELYDAVIDWEYGDYCEVYRFNDK